MFSRIVLSTLLGASVLSAQAILDRPEKLTFKPLVYQAPLTKDFKAKLKNGIPVYIAADPTIAFVRVNLLYKGGFFQGTPGQEGLTSLAGTQWRPGGTLKTPADKLDERLEFLAASISSGSGNTSGNLSLSVLEKDLEEGLKLFMEVLQEPAYAQDRLDLAKKNLRQSLERRNDTPQSISNYWRVILLHGESHFMGRWVTPQSLDTVSQADLKAFHAQLMNPANFVVAVSGKFDRKVMLDRLNATLGALKAGPEAKVTPKVPAPDHVRKPGIYVVDKDLPQAVVNFTLPGLRRGDPDWFPAYVMNEILGGGGFTARLMKKIRSDEGLTYGIYSSLEEGPYYRGDWTCQFQTKNTSVAYAMRLALAEIERMKQELVTPEDLAVTKDGIILGFPSNFSSKGAIVGTFAREALVGWPEDFYADFRAKVQAVTREEVQRVARKYLDPSQMVLLVVGKAAEVEAGDVKDHPGALKDILPLPTQRLPLRDPLTMKPLK
jgi:zinc protease